MSWDGQSSLVRTRRSQREALWAAMAHRCCRGHGRPGCDQRSQEGAVRGASEHGSAYGGSWVCAEAGETARLVSALSPAEGGSLLCASEHSFQEPLGWGGSLNPGVVTRSGENGSIPSSPATPPRPPHSSPASSAAFPVCVRVHAGRKPSLCDFHHNSIFQGGNGSKWVPLLQ